jgi:hypothetical protein
MRRQAWLKTFPKPQADKAINALQLAWKEMACRHRTDFNRETIEPRLTLVVASYLRDVISTRLRLLGHWGAEDVKSKVDFSTGKIIERIRTDIEYLWNNEKQNLCIVFEFKRLGRDSGSRKHYYGENGLRRFVTGSYSLKHPLAVMVAVVLDDRNACVTPLTEDLQTEVIAGPLAMRKHEGAYLHSPSPLFPGVADFDTEHIRESAKAPAHGTICVSHMFLEFGYPPI